jgi:hypothetical protein
MFIEKLNADSNIGNDFIETTRKRLHQTNLTQTLAGNFFYANVLHYIN